MPFVVHDFSGLNGYVVGGAFILVAVDKYVVKKCCQ